MNRKVKILVMILLSLYAMVAVSIAGEPEAYRQAVDSYSQKEYKKARKYFNEVIKKYSETEWEYPSRLYIARCWREEGNLKKAFKGIEPLLDNLSRLKILSPEFVIEELGKIGSKDSLNKLKELVKTSKIKEIRIKSSEIIGKIARKAEPDDINVNIDYMLEILKAEPEMEVAKAVSIAIHEMGIIESSRLLRLYNRADKFLKKKLLLLISGYDDEDLIMALQEETESESSIVVNYISWALAKMDPYRFAILYKGKLKRYENKYILHGDKYKVELLSPSLRRGEKEELNILVGKKVTLYGVKINEGVIYTDLFKSK